MDGWMDEQTDEWTNEWVMNGCVGVSKHVSVHIWTTGVASWSTVDQMNGSVTTCMKGVGGWTDWRWLAQIFPFIKKWGLPSPLCLKLLRKRGCTKSFFLFTRSFPPFSISHFLSAYFIHIYHFLKTLSLHTNSRKERLTPEACDIHRETRGGEGIAIVVSIRYLNVSSGRGSDVSNATNKCIQ